MNKIARLSLSVISGILLSLAWLGLPGWTLFIALLPLLMVEDFMVIHKDKFKSASFWFYALITCLIWNSLTTWWIGNATVIGALLAIITNSFLMSIVWLLMHSMHRNFKSSLGYFSLIVFWLSFEYFHYHWEIEWPWLNMGNGFANNIQLIQWYEYSGILGGTFWILLLNILFFHLYKFYAIKKKVSYRYLIYIVIVISVPMLISYKMYKDYKEDVNPQRFVIVQPNINPYNESYDSAAEEIKLKSFLNLAEEKMDKSVNFVVGPETVFERSGDWNEDRLEYNPLYSNIERWLIQNPQVSLIFGTSSSRFYPHANYTRTARSNNGYHYDVFNTAFMMQYDQPDQIYHKSILVNGVEKIPFLKYLKGLNRIFINLGGAAGSLGSQNESSNFVSKNGTTVAPVICYESVFGSYVNSYIKKGAQAIVIITNDGWWKNTPGFKQHHSYARLRAIETRRSVVRSANTGISAFINQRGDVLQSTEWWVPTAIKGDINLNDKITFYVKYGDYLSRISIFTSILLLLYLITVKLRK